MTTEVKKMLFVFVLIVPFYAGIGFCQTGINTTTPDINSVLDIVSTSKGVLIPRLNNDQMIVLAANNPPEGMLIFNTELECIQIYSATNDIFECLTTQTNTDLSKDAWENNAASTSVELSSTSDDSTPRTAGTEVVVKDDGKVGIGTTTPQKKLHVAGTAQITGELTVGGDVDTEGSAGTEGQFLTSNGPGAAPSWQAPAGIVPSSNGTVIAVNGKLLIAEEITVQMASNYTISASGSTSEIGNLTVEIIDNNNRYSGTSDSNSFSVTESGVYLVTLNMMLYLPYNNNQTNNPNNVALRPVVGIWDNDGGNNGTGAWVARVNDDIEPYKLQTYTLITAIPMDSSHTYSFRVSTNAGTLTIYARSTGETGSGPVSQASVKRLR